ncbi:uncharacterized protein LOC144129144 [Amblyomma americanum]
MSVGRATRRQLAPSWAWPRRWTTSQCRRGHAFPFHPRWRWSRTSVALVSQHVRTFLWGPSSDQSRPPGIELSRAHHVSSSRCFQRRAVPLALTPPTSTSATGCALWSQHQSRRCRTSLPTSLVKISTSACRSQSTVVTRYMLAMHHLMDARWPVPQKNRLWLLLHQCPLNRVAHRRSGKGGVRQEMCHSPGLQQRSPSFLKQTKGKRSQVATRRQTAQSARRQHRVRSPRTIISSGHALSVAVCTGTVCNLHGTCKTITGLHICGNSWGGSVRVAGPALCVAVEDLGHSRWPCSRAKLRLLQALKMFKPQ